VWARPFLWKGFKMAGSFEEIATVASLELGGEPIRSFSNPTSELDRSCKPIWDSSLRNVLSITNWNCMLEISEMTKETADPGIYNHSFLPDPKMTCRSPLMVFRSLDERPITDFKIVGRNILSNHDRLWSLHTVQKPVEEWPGYFEELMIAVIKSRLTFLITGSSTAAEANRLNAYGNRSENGFGGAVGTALSVDAVGDGEMGFSVDELVAHYLAG